MTTTLLQTYATSPSDETFRPLIAQYINLVYSACLRQLRDAHRAEDATQAVFLLLHRRAGDVDPQRLSGWLLTAARFTCANIRKQEQRRARREQGAAMLNSAPATPAATAADVEILQLLDQALDHINSADREAIALHYLQDQSHAAVGAATGVSEDAARKRTARALEKLRSWFARRGIVASAAALATLLSAQRHAAALSTPLVDSLTRSILQTCHAGASAPAVALAKGTQNMMLRHTLGKAAAATLIVAAVAVTGWWAFVSSASAQSVSPVEAPASAVALDFSTPEHTLASYVAAFKSGDRKAVDSCCSGERPATPAPADAVLSFMLAQNRLIRAASQAYNTDGEEARISPTIDHILEKVVAYDAATHQTATITGDTATLPFKLPEAAIAAAPVEVQPQIRAFLDRPIHFVKEGNQWKLPRSVGTTSIINVVLVDAAGKPVNDPAIEIRVVDDYAAVLDLTAAGIVSGKYPTWDQAQAFLMAGKHQLHDNYALSDIGFAFSPAPNQP